MDKPMSDFHFEFMSFGYIFRDLFSSRKKVLAEVGIKPGYHLLDYGCGPGGYIIAAAELVGEAGKIYALDIHPLAIQKVKGICSKKQLANVVTILSDCKTGLPDNSVDVVLLYDIFHGLSNPGEVLAELHRILKQQGILSCSDHHLTEGEIVSAITGHGLFKPLSTGKITHNFTKEG